MKSISAIQAKFLRLKVKTDSTNLFEEMGEKNKNIFSENIEPLAEEVMVICFFSSISYWWVLSNLRLIIKENNRINYISLSEIKNIELNEIFNNEIKKQDCLNIDLSLQSSKIKLKVEENTWHAIYNIMKFVTG
jgi:hypothetical protein